MAKTKQRKAKLKVFRTPIGFHDAYVAAPSQKAALEAWGSDTNLFARGEAELVEDAQLAKPALDRPGEVIRVLRGSSAEQLKAAGAAQRKRKSAAAGKPSSRPRERGKKPSRTVVDRAEKALARAEASHDEAVAELRAQEEAVREKRRDLEQMQRAEMRKLAQAVERARDEHEAAMAKWNEPNR